MKKAFFYFIIIVLCGCITPFTGRNNIAYRYKKETTILHPEYVLFNINDLVSSLHIRINSQELLYVKSNTSNNFVSRFKVSLRVLNNNIPIDTLSAIFSDTLVDGNSAHVTRNFSFKAYTGSNYNIEADLFDLNRNHSVKTYLKLDKSNVNSRNNFLLSDEFSKPSFKSYVTENDKITLQYLNKETAKLYIRYYFRDFGIATPPFAASAPKSFNYKSDSTFSMDIIDHKATLPINKNGFYHIQADTLLNKEGMTVFRFEDNFPDIRSANDMMPPLRYITSKTEYEEISKAENIKGAIDNFWIKSAGGSERARELIKRYYNRVQEANRLFTSYLEGWKSDRGMIFIIFGPPNIVYNYSQNEVWIYGEENNLMSINFNFYKVQNPFTDNDYMLERSEAHKGNWYRAVDTWRQGRSF